MSRVQPRRAGAHTPGWLSVQPCPSQTPDPHCTLSVHACPSPRAGALVGPEGGGAGGVGVTGAPGVVGSLGGGVVADGGGAVTVQADIITATSSSLTRMPASYTHSDG